MSYVTITAGFNASGEDAGLVLSTAWLFKLATHRVLSCAKSMLILPISRIAWKNAFRRMAYEIIPNRRYADSVIVLVMGIYESCGRLGMNFKEVELGDWLMFQQSEKEYPPRNITLKDVGEVWVTTFNYDKEGKRIRLGISTSGIYRRILEAMLNEKQPYNSRIVIKSWNIRGCELYVKGELQVTIPLDFYYKHAAKYKENYGELYGGVDVNVDRINLAIVDRYGRLRDVKTFWFEEASRKGCSRRKAGSIIGMAVHGMLKYAYHHGVKMLFLESPEVLGKLKLLWIKSGNRKNRNYNWKVIVFRSSVIETISMKAPLYSIKINYVDPKGTTHSEEHDKTMRRYGLDRHTASAFLIALKGIERYRLLQKVIT